MDGDNYTHLLIFIGWFNFRWIFSFHKISTTWKLFRACGFGQWNSYTANLFIKITPKTNEKYFKFKCCDVNTYADAIYVSEIEIYTNIIYENIYGCNIHMFEACF